MSVICLSLCKFFFYIFNFFSRTTRPISTKLGTKHPWMDGIKVCLNEGPRPSPRGDNSKNVKFYWKKLKIFLSRTTGLISSKLGTNHPWMTGIQVYTIEGPHFSPRGDNSKIVKLYWKYLKIFQFRTTRSISTKLDTKHPWVVEIQVCSNEGTCPSQRGDKSEIVKLYWKYFKILSL